MSPPSHPSGTISVPAAPPISPAERAVRLLRRPELGALAGVIGVWIFFAVMAGDSGFVSERGTSDFLAASAELGIIAIAVALLMIAGEFDLSVGSMIGASTMIVAVGVGSEGWPLWLAMLLAFAVAIFVGLVNGYIVVKTALPSFIVTLAALFVLRGLTIAITRFVTDTTQVGGVGTATEGDFLAEIFTHEFGVWPVEILWWLGLTALGTWTLMRTRFGNWIQGTGGDREAARKSGVRTDRVRILLFVGTACAATLVGIIQTLTVGSGDVLRGELKEFEAIIACVIGGVLLMGGYGSVIGASLGALTFGMASLGIFFAGWDTDWFKVFLGAMLLIAVLANNFVRSKSLEAR
jgi:simple sugar transport system permease protein